jgi:hypothetical protein
VAIQQTVPISITLQGNGIASSYAFKLGDVLAINTAGKGLLINPRAIPVGITAEVVEQPDNGVSASAATGTGIVSLNFQDPLPADQPVTVNMKFYFDSLPLL